MPLALRVKIAIAAVLAAILVASTALLLERSGSSTSKLRLAQMHFSSGDWSAADIAIREAFIYDSIEEPMARSAWILRAKVAAAARGDEAGLEVAKTFVHIYLETLRVDELLELQNWFTQRGHFASADFIRGARQEL